MPRMLVVHGALACLTLAVSGCFPQTPAGTTAPPQAGQAQPLAPRVLTIALQREVASFSHFASGGGRSAIGQQLAHDQLAFEGYRGVWEPQLAAEQISAERGTWRVNPDGSMVTTWRLRPGVKWHDGTPFTSADLLFTYTVYKDPQLPSTVVSAMAAMASASTPDPLTFEVRWSETDVKADQAPGLTPLPRHLLEDVYRTEKEALPAHPYFTTQFVGLGAYRLVGREPGIQMEFARFDDYYQGRPAIDQIVLKYIADPTTMVANVLAGSVDVVTPPGIDVDGAVALRERWAGTSNQVMIQLTSTINSAYSIQFRPEYVRPRAGLPNRDVREALYRAIDRAAMSEALTHGLAPLADSWVGAHHAFRSAIEGAIPQYPYDVAKAQQLLATAGWVRGSDGILVHQPTGERFVIEVSGQQRAIIQKQQPIIAEQWKAIGAEVETHVTPPALDSDRRYESTRPGVLLGSIGDRRLFFDKALHSREAATEENRWSGRNKGGYGNPDSDRLIDQLGRTIDLNERMALVRDLVRIQMEDIPLMPFFWEVEPVVAVASVKIPQGKTLPEYIFEWRKD